ncbi:hypothetical protein Tsubulata_014524 [Turnera subulata]|uniref:RING-type domain-containing protein n=1 Tax=Turnera subulata TaxID=218843 RepID=A0A9Q0J4K5_9ROSI|nr:hypothetical protein Tsubulata_014524 [Turnera subulata]
MDTTTTPPPLQLFAPVLPPTGGTTTPPPLQLFAPVLPGRVVTTPTSRQDFAPFILPPSGGVAMYVHGLQVERSFPLPSPPPPPHIQATAEGQEDMYWVDDVGEIILYDTGDDYDPEYYGTSCSTCAICLTDFKDGDSCKVLDPTCSHMYHVTCIDEWLVVARNCPICRVPVHTYLFND